MNSSENQAFAMPAEHILFYAMIQGAGAGNAPVVPSIVQNKTSMLAFMARSNNFVSIAPGDITRNNTGAYSAKLRDGLPQILDIDANLWGVDGKQAQMVDYNPTTRVMAFGVFSSSGALVDLAATDFVRFTISGQKNVPAY
jgi:hypothetical protein